MEGVTLHDLAADIALLIRELGPREAQYPPGPHW
jgi:hypothetical protein